MRYALLILLIGTASAAAEPYLAVRTGLACHICHANPVGGGLRTPFGNAYAQSTLPARPLIDNGMWTGTIAGRFGIGGDARWSARHFENEDRDDSLEFETDRVTLYGLVKPVEHVTLYLDQQVAPGSSTSREVWFKLDYQSFYLRGGKQFDRGVVEVGHRLRRACRTHKGFVLLEKEQCVSHIIDGLPEQLEQRF